MKVSAILAQGFLYGYQGASHPQESLTVVVQRPKAKSAKSDSSKDESKGEGSPSAAETQAEGDGQASGSDGQAAYEETRTVYTTGLANQATGAQLDVNTKDYAMVLDGEKVTVTGRGTTLGLLLNDAGVTLDDQQNIESIDFVNGLAKTTNVPWADLVDVSHSEATYLMVANAARVHPPAAESPEGSGAAEDGAAGGAATPQAARGPSGISVLAEGDGQDGEGAGEAGAEEGLAEGAPDDGGEGGEPAGDGADVGEATDFSCESANPNDAAWKPDDSGGADEFYDNTRFQIMFDQPEDGGAINADDLRWVHTIVVHMKGIEEEPVEYVGGLRPMISYAPASKGVAALLVAVPSTSIGYANFGYQWERSKDGGATWDQISESTVQTIYVPTDDEHIGNLYRVSVITAKGPSEPSVAVMIVADDSFAVQLDYVPPLAGGWANFTAHVIGADENDPNMIYRWECSNDGGQTWNEIPGESGKTLRRQTYPIEETDDSEEEAGEAALTYIRVVAVLGSKSAISNRQLLAVRTGEDNGADSEQNDGNKDKKSEEIQNAIKEAQELQQVTDGPADEPQKITDSDAGKGKAAEAKAPAASASTTLVNARTSLAKSNVSGISTKNYTGKPLTHKITVKLGSKTLKAGVDYKIVYSDNVDVGYGRVTIEGIGAYNDSVVAMFKINPARITKIKLAKAKLTYTGKPVRPKVAAVYSGSRKLGKKDYEVEYANAASKTVGGYYVLVSGTGNYEGVKIASYEIVKAKNTLTAKAKSKTLKAKGLKKKKITLKKLVTVKKAKGSVTYKNASKAAKLKKFKVNAKSGAITVPKGTKNGTYKIKVKVTAKGNKNYESASKTVTVKIKVK